MNNNAKIKRLINTISNDVSGEISSPSSAVSKQQRGKHIIECINNTGDDLDEFYLVKIIDNDNLSDTSLFIYPESDDDEEIVIYGVLQDHCFDGEIGHVLVAGETFIRIDVERETPITIGEKLYPLIAVDNVGFIGNKASGNTDLLDICIGRALSNQDVDSSLIKVNLQSIGSSDGNVKVVKAASTVNLSLSGIGGVDGTSISLGDLVLAKNQTSSSQNGVYRVSTGSWEFISQPDLVFVNSGTLSAKLLFALTGLNTYSAGCAVYG